MLAGLADLVHSVGPLAAQLHDFRAVHQALAAVGLEVLLSGAPAAQRRCPLLHTAHVEDFPASEDHGTVDDASRDCGHLASRDRHHRFVQHRHALRGQALRNQRLALSQRPEHSQVGIVEPVRYLGHLNEGALRGLGIAAQSL